MAVYIDYKLKATYDGLSLIRFQNRMRLLSPIGIAHASECYWFVPGTVTAEMFD